jgi:hypothetical protein
MKKFFSLTLALLLLLPLFSFASFGDGVWQEADVDDLWQKKKESLGSFEADDGIVENIYKSVFVEESRLLTPLLFTDAFKSMEFELLPTDEDQLPEGKIFYTYGVFPFVNSLGQEVFLHSEELQQILTEQCIKEEATGFDRKYLPYLRGCIKAFGITKEELKAACVKSRENPDAARGVLSVLSDEQFAFLRDGGHLASHIDTHPYLLDALYLPDEQDVRALLMERFAANVGGKTVMVDPFLENRGDHGTPDDEWLEQQDLNTPGFRIFLENAKLVYEEELRRFPNDPAYPVDTPERLAHFEELANRPPKTGEHTGLYALIFTLAVLPLGVFAIGAFKKRRRGAV